MPALIPELRILRNLRLRYRPETKLIVQFHYRGARGNTEYLGPGIFPPAQSEYFLFYCSGSTPMTIDRVDNQPAIGHDSPLPQASIYENPAQSPLSVKAMTALPS